MKVNAPAEKNFRRAKVKPVKQRTGRAWLTWKAAQIGGCLLLTGYTGYRTVDLVGNAPALQVRKVVVRGNVRLSAGELQALTTGLRGSNILTVDLPAYRHRLLDSPWVADAALRRVLPSTVEVFVSERRPMGLTRLNGQLYLVDHHGVVIDEFGPEYSEFDLPIIDGLVRAPGTADAAIDETRAALASRVIEALGKRKELARRVSQIDVSDVHDAVVLLEDDPALLHLGDEDFAQRLQGYIELAPALRERVPDIDYVDLRFDRRVYVGPAGGARGMFPARSQLR
jgi:cell division protein FtsQ